MNESDNVPMNALNIIGFSVSLALSVNLKGVNLNLIKSLISP